MPKKKQKYAWKDRLLARMAIQNMTKFSSQLARELGAWSPNLIVQIHSQSPDIFCRYSQQTAQKTRSTDGQAQKGMCAMSPTTEPEKSTILAPQNVEWWISILSLPCWWAHPCLATTWQRLQSKLCSAKSTGIRRVCNGLGDDVLWTQDPTVYSPRQPQCYKVSRRDSGHHCQATFPAVPGRTANTYGWQCSSSSNTPSGHL